MLLSKLQNQERPYFQITGLLYLIIAIVGGFGIGYMPSVIVAKGDAALTFQNLLNNQGLFRWDITGDIVVLVLEVVLTVMLYRIFKAYSNTAIFITTYTRLAMAIIMGMNLINYMIPAIMSAKPEFLSPFNLAQLESFTLLFIKAQKYGELAWQIFFSIYLFGGSQGRRGKVQAFGIHRELQRCACLPWNGSLFINSAIR